MRENILVAIKKDKNVFAEVYDVTSENVNKAVPGSNKMLTREPVKKVYDIRAMGSFGTIREKCLQAFAFSCYNECQKRGIELESGNFESGFIELFDQLFVESKEKELLAEAVIRPEPEKKNFLGKVRNAFF